MDKLMVLDSKTKKWMGIVCFVPVICFFICFVYYLALVIPETGNYRPYSLETITSQNYDTLFAMLATSAIITAPVFIYCLVVLARMKHMNAAIKLEWIIFLSVMAPVASALFWLFLIKDAPKYVGIHPDIA